MDNDTHIYSVRWTAELRGAHLHSVTYHVRQLDVGKAVDQGLAQVGQLMQERLVLLLNHFVLLLNRLQVALHCGDLKSHIWVTCNMRPTAGSMRTGCRDKDRSFPLKHRGCIWGIRTRAFDSLHLNTWRCPLRRWRCPHCLLALPSLDVLKYGHSHLPHLSLLSCWESH